MPLNRESNPPSAHLSPAHLAGFQMSRRSLLVAALGGPALVAFVAACGNPNLDTADSTPGTTPGTGIVHPTGADDLVIRIGYEGGFVPQGYLFVRMPSLLISGDGRAFTPAVMPAVYPGPLVAPMFVRSINEAGTQQLLALADAAGLLSSPPDYSSDADNMVADAANTVVTIAANGETFVHSAYALGLLTGTESESTPARVALLAFVTAVEDLTAAAGAQNLGVDETLVPADYRIQSYVVAEADVSSADPAPTFVDWPASTGVALADATDCARLTADAAGSTFSDANQNTYFRDAGVLYSVAVAGVLPGDPAC
jgi:hypothetical protein